MRKIERLVVLMFVLVVMIGLESKAAFTYTHGHYRGDGVAGGQAISIGFQPDVVLVKSGSSSGAWVATSSMTAGDCKVLSNNSGGVTSGIIKTLDADGFTVENVASANTSGQVYYFLAFEATDGVAVGSYTGNNGSARAVTGVGFTPGALWILPDWTAWQNTGSVFLYNGRSAECRMSDGGDHGGSWISTYDADGFTMTGYATTGAHTNYYVAFESDDTNIKVASYAGSTGDQNISVGFLPEVSFNVKGTSGDDFIWKSNTMGGDTTLTLGAVSASNAEKILGFSGTGIDLKGNHNEVNTNANTYHYLAFGTSVLPVELGHFNAFRNGSVVELDWLTYSEVQNDYFIVQRSTDGVNFEAIGEVSGMGDSYEITKYQFNDYDAPSAEAVYYRLKQVDYDGTEHFHDIKAVHMNQRNLVDLQMHPNPSSGTGDIRFKSSMEGDYKIRVANILGEVGYQEELRLNEGESNNISIEELLLNQGTYLVSITLPNGSVVTERLVIK